MEDNKVKSSIIIGLAVIITAFILGMAFKNRNENLDSISVIGLGTKILFLTKFLVRKFYNQKF